MIDNMNVMYKRKLKLSPAIGDWTTIQFQNSYEDLDQVSVTPVQSISFDSLTKEQMEKLHYLHYRLAERIAKKMSKDMDIKVELHSITATQINYEEFLDAQTEKVVQSDYIIPTLGRVNVLFDWMLADTIVNRLVGGKGVESETHNFSPLETSILKTQMQSLLPIFTSCWKHVISSKDIITAFHCGDYMYDRKISLREAYVLFTLELCFGKGQIRRVSWAYPNETLRKLMDLKEKIKRPLKQNVVLNRKTLNDIKINVQATLGSTTLTMADLSSLQEGDVIKLDQSFDAPLSINLSPHVQVLAQPGEKNQKICLQVLSVPTQSFDIFAPSLESEEDLDKQAESFTTLDEVVPAAQATIAPETPPIKPETLQEQQLTTSPHVKTSEAAEEPVEMDMVNDDVLDDFVSEEIAMIDNTSNEQDLHESDDGLELDQDFSWDELESESTT